MWRWTGVRYRPMLPFPSAIARQSLAPPAPEYTESYVSARNIKWGVGGESRRVFYGVAARHVGRPRQHGSETWRGVSWYHTRGVTRTEGARGRKRGGGRQAGSGDERKSLVWSGPKRRSRGSGPSDADGDSYADFRFAPISKSNRRLPSESIAILRRYGSDLCARRDKTDEHTRHRSKINALVGFKALPEEACWSTSSSK